MKGLFFILDSMIAFVIILFILSFSLAFLFNNFMNEKNSYKNFSSQVNLIQVSELMVTDSKKGLVVYENNLVKHHLIKQEYWSLKTIKLIDGVSYAIEVLKLGEKSSFKGKSVSRVALCGGNLCVVKVTEE